MAETELATYEHGADAADAVAADIQAGVREMVLYALEPGAVVLWSTAIFPTLARLDCLAEDQLFAGLGETRRRELLHDESEQTAVERGDGHIPAIRFKQPRGVFFETMGIFRGPCQGVGVVQHPFLLMRRKSPKPPRGSSSPKRRCRSSMLLQVLRMVPAAHPAMSNS